MNLITDPRAIAISDGDSDASSSSGSYSRSSYTSRSSMDDLLERALLHGFDHVTRESRDRQARFVTTDVGPSHSFDQVNVFQRRGRPGFPGSSQQTLRQRMDVHIDRDASSTDSSEGEALDLVRKAAYQEQQSTSMERFRRTLEEMKAREFGTPDGKLTDADGGGVGAKKVRHAPDPNARARLIAYNASMKAKQQEKYTDRVAREEAERLAHRPPRVSPVATRAGERLYLGSKGRERVVDALRSEQQKKLEEEEDKACTFEPIITSYARRLAADGGYTDPVQGLERDAERREALELQRLANEANALQQCPFQPTLSPHTNGIIAAQRQRQRGRSGSRGANTSSHEPFDAGERLYRDGGERLLRQQIRQRLAEKGAESERVGQHVVLSPAHAKQVTGRLEAWQRAKERNLVFLRQDAERQAVARSGTASQPLSRTQSAALSDRLAGPAKRSTSAASSQSGSARRVSYLARSSAPDPAPKAAPLRRSVSAGSAVTARSSRPGSATASPGAGSHTATRRQPSSRPLSRSSSQPSSHRTAASRPQTSPLRGDATFRGRWSPQSLTPEQAKLQAEFRRIRFGALFYKYAPTPSSEVLCCRDVRRQVNLYYPEDAGIAEAVRETVSGELVPISKQAFVAALESYEALHGPQPWGRTEKDKLLFPAAAAGAASQKRTSTPSTHTTPSRRTARGSRPGSAPLSRQSSAASASQRTGRPSVQAASQQASSTARSVSASSRANSARGRGLPGAKRASAADADNCTFKPKLNAQTLRLSEIDRQRRLGYAAERDLRRRELHLLGVLNSTGSGSQEPSQDAPSATPIAPVSNCGKPNGVSATAAKTAQAQPMPQMTSTTANRASEGQSPSVELSSLSGSSPSSQERSAAMAAVAAAARRAARKPAATVAPTGTAAARRELETLLAGYEGAPKPQVPTPSPPVTELSPRGHGGFVMHPTNTLLSGPSRAPRSGAHRGKPQSSNGIPSTSAAQPALDGSPNRCEVDELYNALYKGSWF